MIASELSEMQRRFCEEYIIDYNATRAARRSGYKEDQATQIGALLKKMPEVQEYINYLKGEQTVRTKIDADYVRGLIVETIERARGKMEVTEVMTSDGEVIIDAKEFKYDPKSLLKGAELLGKTLAMFTDVVDNRMTFTQMPEVLVGNPGENKEEMKALTFDIGNDPDAPRRSN